MKKLLATSAIAMIALSGAAFAQDANLTEVEDSLTSTDTSLSDVSLLTQVLNQAQDVQINMMNAAENLANLDGSINVLESENVDLLLQELTSGVVFGSPVYTWEVTTPGSVDPATPATTVTFTGTQEEYEAAQAGLTGEQTLALTDVAGGDDFAGILQGVSQTVDGTTAIDFYDPAGVTAALQTDINNLTTTVIGALNTGVIGQNDGTGSIGANILTMANMELESVAQTASSLAQSASYYQPGDLQLANYANNMATIVDASVTIDQLMANVDGVETTLIGALNTGDIAASVNQNASNLTQAIVGQ